MTALAHHPVSASGPWATRFSWRETSMAVHLRMTVRPGLKARSEDYFLTANVLSLLQVSVPCLLSPFASPLGSLLPRSGTPFVILQKGNPGGRGDRAGPEAISNHRQPDHFISEWYCLQAPSFTPEGFLMEECSCAYENIACS